MAESVRADVFNPGNQVYVGNLHVDVTEEELTSLFKVYNPISVKKIQRDKKCFAFVKLPTCEASLQMIQTLHKTMFKGRILIVRQYIQEFARNCPDVTKTSAIKGDIFNVVQRFETINVQIQHDVLSSADVHAVPSRTTSQVEEQPIEPTHDGQQLNLQLSCFGNPEEGDSFQMLPGPMPELEPLPPDTDEDQQAFLGEIFRHFTGPRMSTCTIPLEMRSSFLTKMLRDCYNDLSWLTDIMNVSGEVILLVTNRFPWSPYFWAISLAKDIFTNLKNLLYRLEVQKDQLIYLPKKEVRERTYCLAQCLLFNGEETMFHSRYRCWVVEVMPDAAVVYLLDCGITTSVSLQSLCRLDDDLFWAVPPLAQPFALKDDSDLHDFHGTIITGKISGSCKNEPHILQFSKAEQTVDTPLPRTLSSDL